MKYIFPAAALVLDRVLKHKARSEHLPEVPCPHLEFRHIENDGLAGSTLRDHPQLVKWLPAIGLGVSLPILLKAFKTQRCARKCGLSLLFAGALSNVLDRFLHGTVTDMIHFPKAPGKLKTLVFNLADFMIFFGALLTLLRTVQSTSNQKG